MSINKSHNEADGGILLFNGELILLFCDSVNCEIGGKESFKGRVYLTTHRLVVITTPYRQNAAVKSLCAPFCAIVKCNVEQPIFGANYIEATVRDELDSTKSFSFKLKFSKGGAIELAIAMNKAVALVGRNFNASMPPPQAFAPSPSAEYYQAPPTVYAPGYNSGVQMPLQQFPDAPPVGFIYASSAPPPYPGLNNGGYPGAGQQQQNQQPPPPYSQQPAQQPGYPQSTGQQTGGYPQSTGQQTGGYPQPQNQGGSGYPPVAGYPPTGGYPSAGYPSSGYPQPGAPANPGYPGSQPTPNPQEQSSSSSSYPNLNQAPGYNTAEQPGGSGGAWPSAPAFNPQWKDEKN